MEPDVWFDFGPSYEYSYSPVTGLFRDGERLRLGPMQSELIHALMQKPRQVVPRNELEKRLWPGKFATVPDNSLSELVWTVRILLGCDAANPTFIKTEPRLGYRWIAPVRATSKAVDAAASNNGRAPHADAAVLSDVGAGTSADAAAPRWRYVIAMSVVLALHQLLAAFGESVFVFGDPRPFSLIAPFNALVLLVASAIGMTLDWRATIARRSGGLAIGFGVIGAGLSVAFIAASLVLPASVPTPLTSFAMPPRTGFLKTAIVYQLMLTALVYIPFHIVTALEGELIAGRGGAVHRLLVKSRRANVPGGLLFVAPQTFAYIVAGLAAFGIPMTLHLLSGLPPGEASSTFSQLALVRFLVWWGTAMTAVALYAARLSELRARTLHSQDTSAR
jgi:DNA-binding winged helix-turn-helix (wHTH) protein